MAISTSPNDIPVSPFRRFFSLAISDYNLISEEQIKPRNVAMLEQDIRRLAAWKE